eukprot:12655-Pleurochrysis_carterae.AAC.2
MAAQRAVTLSKIEMAAQLIEREFGAILLAQLTFDSLELSNHRPVGRSWQNLRRRSAWERTCRIEESVVRFDEVGARVALQAKGAQS